MHIANSPAVVAGPTLMFKVVPERTKPVEPAPPPPDFSAIQPPSIVAIMPEFTTAPAPNAIIVKPAPPTPPAPPQQAAPAMKPGPMPPSDYLARLMAHLNAVKRYPYASGTHAQGTVRLRFRMDRGGHLISYEVVGSSGSAALDQAARDMIKAAEPLPPVPDQYPGDVLDLIVPVNYTYVVH